jgi:hypothetical protein
MTENSGALKPLGHALVPHSRSFGTLGWDYRGRGGNAFTRANAGQNEAKNDPLRSKKPGPLKMAPVTLHPAPCPVK